jgi:hypothetical protein
MSDLALRGAIGAVRAWTKLYTSGLASGQRDARREQIDSDLWESVNDTTSDRRMLPLQIVARLVMGIPDDLGWRSEHAAGAPARRWRIALTVAAAAVFALWMVRERTMSAPLPELPASLTVSPHGVRLIDAPPPPPPPPPPCAPEGFPQSPGRCIR